MMRTLFIFLVLFGLAGCGTPPEATPSQTTSPPQSTLVATTPLAESNQPAPTGVVPVTGETTPTSSPLQTELETQEYPVPPGSHPHDVAPAPDGTVWYTAQAKGELGRLDPATSTTKHISLGYGSAPHGVIVGPDGAPWITDGGLNAIVRVDPKTLAVKTYPLPADQKNINMNTAAFDSSGILWFTGQNGFYGQLDPASAEISVYRAPRGSGPYGITSLPDGSVYYASLANNHIARINPKDGSATTIDPPTINQGSRRVWGDSSGKIWVSEWNVGKVAVYNPADGKWREWKLPGDHPLAYAVYVDDQDIVWLSDFDSNSLVRFDPAKEAFTFFPLPSKNGAVRQINGRPGEVWGAESGADKLVVIRTSGK